jgi:hypothetical protein
MAAKKKSVPKGYHRMPNGKLMEGARHERTESKAEKRAEYGPKPKAKKAAKRTSASVRRNNMDM